VAFGDRETTCRKGGGCQVDVEVFVDSKRRTAFLEKVCAWLRKLYVVIFPIHWNGK
jgi:hypothetical protein